MWPVFNEDHTNVIRLLFNEDCSNVKSPVFNENSISLIISPLTKNNQRVRSRYTVYSAG